MPDDIESIFGTAPALPPVILDRSDLERYTVCPCQAVWCERNPQLNRNAAMDAGIEAHRVLAEAVYEFTQGGNPKEYIEAEMLKVRPDVQDRVIAALRPSIWSLTAFLRDHNQLDLRAYQGGKGERSAQFAADILPATRDRGPIRLTSEVDLLLATPAPTELREIDFKTGWQHWSSSDVARAFQFNLHAWLLFKNHPTLERLWVQVWATAWNDRTGPVPWVKSDLPAIEALLAEAVRVRSESLAGEPKCWPDPDKCGTCPCLRDCPAGNPSDKMLADDPPAYARAVALQRAQLEANEAAVETWCDEHGPIAGVVEAKAPSKPRKRWEWKGAGDE